MTLEANPRYAEVARANIDRAGFSDIVEVRVGQALQTLAELCTEGRGPFDVIFIDADKRNNPEYFQWALKLSRSGTLIIADNVVRNGAISTRTRMTPSSATAACRGSAASTRSSRPSPG